MKRTILLALVACVLPAADAPALTCKPVMISAGAELPASIDYSTRPMGYDLGIKIAYLVEGEDLIGFKDDSLAITAITTADGKDISKKRNGKSSWKQGSFPKTTDDGKYGIFSIEVAENVFGKADGVKVVGSIVALTGSDRQTKKLTYKLADAKVEELNGLKVSVKPPTREPGNNGFGLGSSNLSVRVEGDFFRVADVIVYDGETKLSSSGSNWSGTQKSFTFAKPAGESVTVEITWWNKFAAVSVPIGQGK